MVEALVSGEEEAFEKGFEQFCIAYHRPIRRWCRRWFPRDSDADDAAQELLLGLRKKLQKYKPQRDTRFRNWLSRVSSNAAKDFRRKMARRHAEFSDDQVANLPADGQFVFDLMIDFERRTVVQEVLLDAGDQLNAKDRELLEAFLQELPTGDIAERMGIKINAVHQAMFRVREKLKSVVTKELSLRPGLELEDLFASE
ncbi:MAG: RNA polymerase sporulation-specific sigma factor [Pirellulaceae bacterium]|jgi:RNA polymerase sporulation-specific sigma factor